MNIKYILTLHRFVGIFPNLWKFPFEKISNDPDRFNIPSASSVQGLKLNLCLAKFFNCSLD